MSDCARNMCAADVCVCRSFLFFLVLFCTPTVRLPLGGAVRSLLLWVTARRDASRAVLCIMYARTNGRQFRAQPAAAQNAKRFVCKRTDGTLLTFNCTKYVLVKFDYLRSRERVPVPVSTRTCARDVMHIGRACVGEPCADAD